MGLDGPMMFPLYGLFFVVVVIILSQLSGSTIVSSRASLVFNGIFHGEVGSSRSQIHVILAVPLVKILII